MIYVIMYRGRGRGTHSVHWSVKAIIFAGTATIAGASTGAVLGALGAMVPSDVRAVITAALAISGGAIALVELITGSRGRPWEINRETNQVWMNRGPFVASLLNGMTLGAGWPTRLGFWAWYILPVAAFYTGSFAFGATILGLYGLVRGAFPVLLATYIATIKKGDAIDVQDRLLTMRNSLQAGAAAQVLLTSVGFLLS
jgi:hypothetical protein